MADNKTTAGWRTEMHPDEHIGTYNGFLAVAKFTVVTLVVLMSLMAIFLV